jgi:hypothetical protein
MFSPNGVAYPLWKQLNILCASGTVVERAEQQGVSESTVRRVDRRYLMERRIAEARDKKTLSQEDAHALCLFKLTSPTASLAECQQFVTQAQGKLVSTATISRELSRLGFTRKRVQHYSNRRDEASRVSWWTCPPSQGGCFGVPVDAIVDIDESHFPFEKGYRAYGHSMEGMPARVAAQVNS